MKEIISPKKHQPLLYMMIGVPGAGKTTVRNKIIERHPDREFVILSSDDYVESKADELGKTYNETWTDYVKEGTTHMLQQLKIAIEMGADIIWDQTCLTKKARKGKLSQVPKNYFKIASVVQTSKKTILERNKIRREFGRTIPDKVLNQMLESFQFPTSVDEDFDKIELYQNGDVE